MQQALAYQSNECVTEGSRRVGDGTGDGGKAAEEGGRGVRVVVRD